MRCRCWCRSPCSPPARFRRAGCCARSKCSAFMSDCLPGSRSGWRGSRSWRAGGRRSWRPSPPGYVPRIHGAALLAAVAITVVCIHAWRHLQPRMPARWLAGVALAWGLAMTLWLPWLDHGKSYRGVIEDMKAHAAPGASRRAASRSRSARCSTTSPASAPGWAIARTWWCTRQAPTCRMPGRDGSRSGGARAQGTAKSTSGSSSR